MTRRLTLVDLRRACLRVLDDEWRTPTDVCNVLRLGHGFDWVRVALVLERLAADGEAELKTPGSKVRKFRRALRDEVAA